MLHLTEPTIVGNRSQLWLLIWWSHYALRMWEGDHTGTEIGLIGRDGDPRAILTLLENNPLVTLIGTGGVGKTTLALAVAAEAADHFPGGVHVAELSGVSHDEDVEAFVARQMDANSLEGLRLRSMGQRTLIVLDNCESALAASRTIADRLTRDRSAIQVLATSRSPLYASGERLVPVSPLSVASEEDDIEDATSLSAAEQLFLLRAEAAGSSWEHSPANLAAVRQLTRQLNGLPLAIELAAARSRVLGPSELVQLLDRQLDLLVRPGGPKVRHHSLRSVIQSSYEPLSEQLQQCLRSLSFMAAPFDLELAHAVANAGATELETLDLISELVNASLLEARQSRSERTEYLLLDSIRAFGHEQLSEFSEWTDVGERYATALSARAKKMLAVAVDAFTPEVMTMMEDNFSHVVNAITWCLANDPDADRAYQMILLFFGPTGASVEVAELTRRINERWSDPAPLQAEAYAVMGSVIFETGHYDEGAALATAAVSHPDAGDMAKLIGYRILAFTAGVHRDSAAAIEHMDMALLYGPAASAAYDRELRASRTAMIWEPGGSAEALQALVEVLDEATRDDDLVMVVWVRIMMAYHHRLLDELPAAMESSRAALDIAEETAVPWAAMAAHLNMAQMLASSRRIPEALPHFHEAMNACILMGDLDGLAIVLRTAAGAALHNGDSAMAEQLWATVPALPGVSVPPSLFEAQEHELNALHGPPSIGDIQTLAPVARTLLTQSVEQEPSQPGTQPATGSDLAGQVVVFGDYEFDPAMCELRKNGERVTMEPQVYDVLAYLIERRGRVVSKHELLDEVWGDRFVSEGALSSRIAAARRATGDNGKAQQVIRTLHGKGFTFVAEVEA
jgi:predicted ATPase/DNA-binding winged helix-turn-helix (wHTH) protein